MKVYEILSEAPAVPAGYTTTASGLMVPNNSVSPPAAAPAPTTAPVNTNPYYQAGARTAKNTQRLNKLKGKGLVGDAKVAYAKLVQQLKGRGKAADIWKTAQATKSAVGAAKLATFMKNVGGPLSMFVKAVDLYDIITDYYTAIGAVEEAHQNGDLSEDAAESQTIFKSYVSQLNGVLSVKLTTWFLHARTSFNIALWIARIVRWIVGGTSAVATGGIGLAAVVATEAFFIWLERWIDTDEGRDWFLTGVVGSMIIGLGRIEGSVWDALFGYYKKQDKAKATVQNKKALDTATTPADKAAAQQKIDTEKATQDRSDDIDALQKQLK